MCFGSFAVFIALTNLLQLHGCEFEVRLLADWIERRARELVRRPVMGVVAAVPVPVVERDEYVARGDVAEARRRAHGPAPRAHLDEVAGRDAALRRVVLAQLDVDLGRGAL